MTTLISGEVAGKKRYCNSKCYNAKKPKCHCICNGMNHSKGEQQATDNTERAAQMLVKEKGYIIKPIQLKMGV